MKNKPSKSGKLTNKSFNKSSKSSSKSKNLWIMIIIIIIILLVLVAVILIYDNQRRAYFDSKYSEMNVAYSKVLEATSSEDPDAENLMLDYVMKWSEFYELYDQKPIPPFTNDPKWSDSLSKISGIVFNATESINTQDYFQAHSSLLEIKNIWSDVFTRNGVQPIN